MLEGSRNKTDFPLRSPWQVFLAPSYRPLSRIIVPLIPDYYYYYWQGRMKQKNPYTFFTLHTVSGRIGTNGSDVLLPTPLLLLPRHEQLRLISSYCFTRRGKVSFRLASFSFLRAFYPLPRIFFSRQRVYIVCASSCDREHLERCFFQRAFPLIITDNVIRTPPSTRFSNSLVFKFFFSFRCASIRVEFTRKDLLSKSCINRIVRNRRVYFRTENS